MNSKPVSVILPTYNERDNIIPLIETIRKQFNPQEIIIVDDNSPDGTADIIRRYSGTSKTVRLISNSTRIGLTKSIQKGIDAATTKYICFMDADFSHPPELLPDLYKTLKNNDLVIASWFLTGGKDIRKELITKFFSNSINKICQKIFGDRVTAYTSGFMMAKRKIFDNFTLRGTHGEYFIDLAVRNIRKSYKITEIPFSIPSRKFGESKTAANPLVYIINGLRYMCMIVLLSWEGIRVAFRLRL